MHFLAGYVLISIAAKQIKQLSQFILLLDKQHQDYIYRVARDSHFAPKPIPCSVHKGGFCSLQVRIYTGKSLFLSLGYIYCLFAGINIKFCRELSQFFFTDLISPTTRKLTYGVGIILTLESLEIQVERT